jgi:hypothetical protein
VSDRSYTGILAFELDVDPIAAHTCVRISVGQQNGTTPTASITEEDAHSFEIAAGVTILITTQNRKMCVNLLSKKRCLRAKPASSTFRIKSTKSTYNVISVE